jgi:hypothetical protein
MTGSWYPSNTQIMSPSLVAGGATPIYSLSIWELREVLPYFISLIDHLPFSQGAAALCACVGTPYDNGDFLTSPKRQRLENDLITLDFQSRSRRRTRPSFTLGLLWMSSGSVESSRPAHKPETIHPRNQKGSRCDIACLHVYFDKWTVS